MIQAELFASKFGIRVRSVEGGNSRHARGAKSIYNQLVPNAQMRIY